MLDPFPLYLAVGSQRENGERRQQNKNKTWHLNERAYITPSLCHTPRQLANENTISRQAQLNGVWDLYIDSLLVQQCCGWSSSALHVFPSKVRPFANSYLHRNLNGGVIVSHVSVNFIELFNQFILPRFTANGKEGNRIFCSSCLVFNNLSVLYCTRPLKLNVCQKSPSIINTILVYSAALYMPACVRVYNRPAFLIVISACPISLNQH